MALRMAYFAYGMSLILPRDAMHSAVLVIVNLSICPSVCLSHSWVVSSTWQTIITIMISSKHGSGMILVFWRQIRSPHSNGMTFKFKVKYKWGKQNVVFSIKTACISETVRIRRTLIRPLIATHIRAFDWYHARSMSLNDI